MLASSICSLVACACIACLLALATCLLDGEYDMGIGIPLVEDLLLVVGLPKMTYFDRKGHSTKLFLSYFQFPFLFLPFLFVPTTTKTIHDRNLDFIETSTTTRSNADPSNKRKRKLQASDSDLYHHLIEPSRPRDCVEISPQLHLYNIDTLNISGTNR